MNKYQKALDELSYPLSDSSCGGCKCGESDCSCKKSEAVKTLNELVEKATPKKVNNATREDYMKTGYKHCCPTCGNLVGTILSDLTIQEDDYCPTCGQALDWSEEE